MSAATTEPSRIRWWLWPQVLCLDAPIVTVSWMAALAQGHRLHLQPSFYWGLALVTWIVYVLDRTADGTSGRLKAPLSARHEFCRQHQKLSLRVLVPAASLVVVWLGLTSVPQGLLMNGLGLCVAGAIYLAAFSAQRGWLRTVLFIVAAVAGLSVIGLMPLPGTIRLILSGALIAAVISAIRSTPDEKIQSWVPKEFIASLLIALGCSAGVHFWTPHEHGMLCPEVKLLWGLVLLNLVSIHWCEQARGEHGEAHGPSLAGHRPWLQIALIAGLIVLGADAWFSTQNLGVGVTALVASISALLTGLLHLWARRVSTELFHVLADAALLVPLPLLWWLL
jgi:hypothetical protein